MTPFQRKEEARGGEQGAEKSSQDGTAGRAVSWAAGQWQKGSLNPQISQNEGNESVTWDDVWKWRQNQLRPEWKPAAVTWLPVPGQPSSCGLTVRAAWLCALATGSRSFLPAWTGPHSGSTVASAPVPHSPFFQALSAPGQCSWSVLLDLGPHVCLFPSLPQISSRANTSSCTASSLGMRGGSSSDM